MRFACCFVLMLRRPPRATRTDTLCPYTTLFRSEAAAAVRCQRGCRRVGTLFRIALYDHMLLWPDKSELMSRFCVGVTQEGNRPADVGADAWRSEEHTSELQSLMRTSYAVL